LESEEKASASSPFCFLEEDILMATPAQIAANRANAQKSTGPRSVEGKAASRFNALKHGLDAASIVIPGEDPVLYDEIAQNYHAEFRPASALEQFHVETLIRCDWQKRRLQRTEGKLYRALLAEGADPEDLDVAVLRDSPTAKLLLKVWAQIASLERAFFRALTDLRRMQREREKTEDASFDAMIDAFCAPPIEEELAPFRQNRHQPAKTACAAAPAPISVAKTPAPPAASERV